MHFFKKVFFLLARERAEEGINEPGGREGEIWQSENKNVEGVSATAAYIREHFRLWVHIGIALEATNCTETRPPSAQLHLIRKAILEWVPSTQSHPELATFRTVCD